MAPGRAGVSHLFCFGLGYVAANLGRALLAEGWSAGGTARDETAARKLRAQGFDTVIFTGRAPSPAVLPALARATHVLLSVPPEAQGDPVLRHHHAEVARLAHMPWIGYLSTVGVYGGQDGEWVDEATPPNPASERGHARLAAERAWLEMGTAAGAAVHIFRLAGIYGPGRSAIDSLSAGTARRIVKPGQVFNRVHVDDIATVLRASMARPEPGAVYNVADDEPAPPQDVVAYAAQLLGVEPPPEVAFEDAQLSPMARGFYAANQRVANRRLKDALGVSLAYPTYRQGLAAILAERAAR